MYSLLIVAVMFSILVSLGASLYFLVSDRGKSRRTVIALSIRVALSAILLALLAWGLASRILPAAA